MFWFMTWNISILRWRYTMPPWSEYTRPVLRMIPIFWRSKSSELAHERYPASLSYISMVGFCWPFFSGDGFPGDILIHMKKNLVPIKSLLDPYIPIISLSHPDIPKSDLPYWVLDHGQVTSRSPAAASGPNSLPQCPGWNFPVTGNFNIWGFPYTGVSKNRWFVVGNPIQMNDLGVPWRTHGF